VSIEIVRTEIRKFLASSESEVVSITGDWGVGKTYAWRRYLVEARDEKKIGLKHYSYVSLFGLNSLEDLKYSIFENTVDESVIDVPPSLATFKSHTETIGKVPEGCELPPTVACCEDSHRRSRPRLVSVG